MASVTYSIPSRLDDSRSTELCCSKPAIIERFRPGHQTSRIFAPANSLARQSIDSTSPCFLLQRARQRGTWKSDSDSESGRVVMELYGIRGWNHRPFIPATVSNQPRSSAIDRVIRASGRHHLLEWQCDGEPWLVTLLLVSTLYPLAQGFLSAALTLDGSPPFGAEPALPPLAPDKVVSGM